VIENLSAHPVARSSERTADESMAVEKVTELEERDLTSVEPEQRKPWERQGQEEVMCQMKYKAFGLLVFRYPPLLRKRDPREGGTRTHLTAVLVQRLEILKFHSLRIVHAFV